ncbi:bifunctional glycosyltransferase/CDP-glycerol:glycerophosphate glycerophosphotransferase [Actinocatenispora sera]|uniref:bifunctional glycosyltransferase/CDP-glycerol:glycerophosphate glycerophosphotransferase n=1 Tax=Actinocatenispora sera TaxID=390989 RepID=UPI000A06651F|nr:bifunctional glycosyltransferase family 2 protein/CDP-glycerol:glycerophosphate glycerophosphotransferase [Actinocatenispora sera]
MPLLSIVVPVYKVQGYLRDCLDSLLNQQFRDIEVIAVDDRSPDHSGAIIDEYEAADPRVTAVHLPVNGGLGPARNAGLKLATGEYVWFVDSDDWIAPESLTAIAERLAATAPDVLVVDYARAYWDNRIVRNSAAAQLQGAPEVFRIDEFPQLLQVFPCAWTKIVRRENLLRWNLEFPPGYYEDLPFTYPLLCAADRITILDQVVVYYRQRRHGSILRTNGEKHLVMLDQYQLTFERLAALGDRATPILPVVYGRMVDHLLVLLGGSPRLGSDHPANSLRRRFFAGAARLCRAHEPAGWTPPPELGHPVRYRLLKQGSWARFSGPRLALRALRMARGKVRGLRRRGGRLKYRLKRSLLYRYYRVQCKLPVDENLAVYEIYWGAGYGCHNRAIYEKARELAPNVRGIWLVKPEAVATMPPGVEYAVNGSAAYYRVLARARYLFNNVNFPVSTPKRPGSVHIQTHHGTPLKAMGIDTQNSPILAAQNNFAELLRKCDRWDYAISSSPYCSVVWEHAYPISVTTLEYGSPRNDVLTTAPADSAARLRAELGIGADEKVVLYAPTFREYRKPGDPLIDHRELADALGPNSRLLVRGHHLDRGGDGTDADGRVIDVSDRGDIQDLYPIADVLLTDYSSAMFDFLVLDRPVVVFAPDWELYRTLRGAYFDLMAEAPGLVARTSEELLTALRTGAYASPELDAARRRFRAVFCPYDDGHATERVVRKVFHGEDPDPFGPAAPLSGVLPRPLVPAPAVD